LLSSVSRLTSHALAPALPVACLLSPDSSVSCPSDSRLTISDSRTRRPPNVYLFKSKYRSQCNIR
jgi:hypothetical protein